ncbi:MAG: hypothetical protein PW792_01270 [Acidobacteriaceae bacterium]|nr:hypothetical protein [Acidobacteriaceae bacterium]
MDNDATFRLVTRAVAVVAFLFALVQLLSFPSDLHGMLHYVRNMHSMSAADDAYRSYQTYWIRYYGIALLSRLISFAVSFSVGMAHVHGGERVHRFYGA